MRNVTFIGVILILLLCHPAYSQRRAGGSDPFRKYVTALPPADRVEVLTVSPFLTEDDQTVDCSSGSLRCKPGSFPLKIDSSRTLTGADADKLSAMWRKLERNYFYSSDKCFYPDHILRFYQGAHLLLETEVCAFCRKITLPNVGMVHVDGSLKLSYYDFREFLLPYSQLRQEVENFKQDMMPKLGQRITVIGILGGSKPAMAVSLAGWGQIYIHRMEISEANYLVNLGCHVVIKVTGTLQFWPGREPQKNESRVVEQTVPEHLYFNDADIKVIKIYPRPRPKRPKAYRRRTHRRAA